MSTSNWDERYSRGQRLPWEGIPGWLPTTLGKHGPRPLRALDLGCGTGVKSRWLAEQGFTVHAIDSSEEAIREARRASDSRISYHLADLKDLGALEQPGGFGLILDSLGSQFLAQDLQSRFFAAVRSLLSAEGIFVYVRLQAVGAEAPTWVQSLTVHPSRIAGWLNDFVPLEHDTTPSPNLPDTEALRYVLRTT